VQCLTLFILIYLFIYFNQVNSSRHVTMVAMNNKLLGH